MISYWGVDHGGGEEVSKTTNRQQRQRRKAAGYTAAYGTYVGGLGTALLGGNQYADSIHSRGMSKINVDTANFAFNNRDSYVHSAVRANKMGSRTQAANNLHDAKVAHKRGLYHMDRAEKFGNASKVQRLKAMRRFKQGGALVGASAGIAGITNYATKPPKRRQR